MITKAVLFFFSLFFISTSFSKNIEIQLKKNKVIPNYNYKLTGNYPTIPLKRFNNFNTQVINFIDKNLDIKNSSLIEVSYEQNFQNKNFLSFTLYYNISDVTERYFSKYYTVNLNSNKEIALSDYLKFQKISEKKLNKTLNKFIKPCLSDEDKINIDYCSDMALQSLLDNKQKNTLDISNSSGFFIKNNNEIGIGFNSNKFTTTFIFDIKKQNVNLN